VRNKTGLWTVFCVLMTGSWVLPSHANAEEYFAGDNVGVLLRGTKRDEVTTAPIGGAGAIVTVSNHGRRGVNPFTGEPITFKAKPSACDSIEVKLIKYSYSVPTTTLPITEPIADGEEAATIEILNGEVSSVLIPSVPEKLMVVEIRIDSVKDFEAFAKQTGNELMAVCDVKIAAMLVDDLGNPTGDYVPLGYGGPYGWGAYPGFSTMDSGQVLQ
jgi:hypothetical protein